jgi:transglutaminase-like putative cysteine protease
MVRISTVLNILTCCIAIMGYAPLSPYLETVPRFIFPAALVAGFIADRKGRWLAGSLATVVSILFFAFYAAQLQRDNLIVPAVNLLTVLLSVRLVSEKKVRNYQQIFALSLFSLAASSLFTLDTLFLFYLIALLFLVAVALVILTFHGADNALVLPVAGVKGILSAACLMPSAALPLMCIFFIILPRTQYPLWNFLNASGSRVAGFSEKVEPGSSPSVGEVRKPVFRVNCGKLAKEQLYWRGGVLNAVVANAWVTGELPSGESGYVADTGAVRHTVYPEPGRSAYLFTLNVPLRFSGIRASLSGDFVLKSRFATARRARYDVESVPGGVIRTRDKIDSEYYLRLPSPLSRRMAAVGREIAWEGKTDKERVELLKGFFLTSRINYATSGLPVSADPIDEFLFVKKRGNCEFFASSFALLLRAAGVPARLVGGYLGGEYNDLGGYYLVTEDMAHVWVEAHISGVGWVMIDPSTMSANIRSFGENRDRGLAFRVGMYIDSFNYYWNMAVISYDLEKQFRLLNKVNFQIKQLPVAFKPGKFLFWAGIALILPALVMAVARSRRGTREEKILRRFLRKLKGKYPFERLPSTGLHELAAHSGDPRVGKFVEVYCRAVYRDRKLTGEEYRVLKALLRDL